MILDKKLTTIEKAGIVLDIGIAYTKIGFVGENQPRKIIKTPDQLFKQFKEIDIGQQYVQLANQVNNQEELDNQIEMYLTKIFIYELLTKPKDRQIYICENYLMPRQFIESIAKILFQKFEATIVHFMLNNTLPLYITGIYTGLVVEVGYADTQITPIFEGYALMNNFIHINAGGYLINKTLKQNIIEDNIEQNQAESQQQQNLQKQIDFTTLEDIKFKYCKILNRNQSNQYFVNEQNIENMKKTKQQWNSQKFKIYLSYYTTINCMEKIFGDPENDEPNIAYSILKCLDKIDASCLPKICQNIVLSGGVACVNNFIVRLRQEILYFFNETKQFDKIKNILPYISFTQLIYPSNVLIWIGASLVGTLNHLEKFTITQQQYQKEGFRLPDIYGAAYLMTNKKDSKLLQQSDEQEII